MHIFFYLFVLFISPNLVTCIHHHKHHQQQQHRRILHQPFFPQEVIPPTQSPESQPPSPPQHQQPKYPFSTTTPAKPTFFPSYPSPPPPPPSRDTTPATFPANISSLILPHSSHKKPISPKLIVVAVLLSVCLLAFLFSVLLLVYYHRRHRRAAPPKANFRSDSHRLFPSNLSHYSDGGDHKPPRRGPPSVSSTNNSSEFLYLGTLVNSRGGGGGGGGGVDAPTGMGGVDASSPYRKLDSPELHPLPPLSRNNHLNLSRHNTSSDYSDEDEDEDEEFYSPRGSSADKESPSLLRSTSTTLFPVAAGQQDDDPQEEEQTSSSHRAHLNPRTSTSTTTSTTSSTTSSLSSRSFKSSFPVPVVAPPIPPPPPPPLRPMTPSPPKRKPPSPSPPYSPPKPNPTHPRFLRSHPYPHTTTNIAGLSRQTPPPPPPPPPPPQTQSDYAPPASTPPLLVTPVKHVAFHSPAAVSPAEFIENNPPLAEETSKPKLKPLHWDKVRASSDRAMVWDQLKSSSFQLNEEMIETLFVVNGNNNVNHKESTWRPVLPSPNNENRVLDPKKSQNIAILLRALNVTIEEVCEALSEGNADTLGNDLLESLLKMAPTKEEERKLKEYKDDSPFKLGPAERFLKAVLDIPFAFKRVDAMLYIANFDSEVDYLKKSFETLEVACEELRNSRMFMKLLEAVLKTGNRMNVGTNRGDAHAFKLDTLLKLVDVKGTDGKTTLLHFVVQEIIRAEGSRLSNANQSLAAKSQQDSFQSEVEFRKLGLQVVSSLSGELSNVKKAASMDSDVLSNDVSALSRGIGNIGEVVRLNESSGLKENSERFSYSMNNFLKKAEEEIIRVQAQESVALSLVKEITEYFHGNSAKEEAHPFRIFTVVRDFLSFLDQVCREVGKINERTIVSSARQFPVPVNPTQPPVFPVFHVRQQYSSSDEESSSLSS